MNAPQPFFREGLRTYLPAKKEEAKVRKVRFISGTVAVVGLTGRFVPGKSNKFIGIQPGKRFLTLFRYLGHVRGSVLVKRKFPANGSKNRWSHFLWVTFSEGGRFEKHHESKIIRLIFGICQMNVTLGGTILSEVVL